MPADKWANARQEMSVKMYDKEQIGATVPHDLLNPIQGADKGPLKGLSFMVKDLFEVVGHKTGNGSPDFFAHPT